MTEPNTAAFYRPDGSWSCTRDHVTEPCGDCDGCRQVMAEHLRPGAPVYVDGLGEFTVADLLPHAFAL